MDKKPIPEGKEKVLYEGITLELVQQPLRIEEQIKRFEMVRAVPGTRLMTIKNGRMLLSREYGRDSEEFNYKLPGGKVFGNLAEYKKAIEIGSDMLWAVKEGTIKKAREEVGIMPNQLELYYLSKNGEAIEWDLYFMEITDFEDTGSQKLDGEGEDITFDWFTFEDVKDIALSGKMKEDRSVGVLLRYLKDLV